MSVLGSVEQQTLSSAAQFISQTLCNRLKPMIDTNSLENIYESLTAVVYLMSSASNPQFVSKEARRESFNRNNWQLLGRTQSVHVEDMVESGFYSLGDVDHVKCFFCDLRLKDWDASDQPQREHAKFSPLCFFLKSSRGLNWLRSLSARPPNYPSSYTRQDHNQLLKTLCDEFSSAHSQIVCSLGFCDTKVLLCISRKYIRFRQKFNQQELLLEMQKEWDKEILGISEPQFVGQFDLAAAGRQFHNAIPNPIPSNSHVQSAIKSCLVCDNHSSHIVCLPCSHISLCIICSRSIRFCPERNCGQAIDSFVRVFDQGEQVTGVHVRQVCIPVLNSNDIDGDSV